MIGEYLFCRGHLRDYLERRKLELKRETESLEPNYVLNVSETDLLKHLLDKYKVDTSHLRADEVYVYDQSEADIDVSNDVSRAILNRSRPFYVKGVSVTIAVPFDGDGELFDYQPSTFTSNPPRGEIVGQEVHLIYQSVDHDAEKLKQVYTSDVNQVNQYLTYATNDVKSFNESLDPLVRQLVAKRKQKLLNDQGLVASLGIPIRKSSDLPKTYTLPDIRKKPKIERPQVRNEPFTPEPALPLREYENILSIIQNMVLVMERSPKAFENMKEEDLRQHFLVQLNGQYEGRATGETFNYEGKTDILIRENGKNIFIAECKFWKGEKELLRAIDQLLGYASWRDTKTALLVFNRGKDFSSVLEKVSSAAKKHSCFKRDLGQKDETTFRYVFHQPDDVNRELTLTILIFNVPSKEKVEDGQ